MLRYTTDTIAKYWNSEDYRIFTMKVNENGHLILISSNETNSKLYGISEPCIGKSLYDIMEKEHADRWHLRFQEWKKLALTSYISYFGDTTVAWDTTIEIKNDLVFGVGKKVLPEELDHLTFEKHEFFNHYFIHPEDFMLITLSVQPDCDSLLIESIDSPYDPMYHAPFLGQDISSITFFCSNILDKKVYKKCLQTNKTVHFVERFDKDEHTLFLDVNLCPYLKRSKIIIYAKVINEPTYRDIQKKISNIYGVYPETDHFAVCEINYDDPENPYMIGCNLAFKNLEHSTDITLASILCNQTFERCLISSLKETGHLKLEHHLGKVKHYKLDVSPVTDSGYHNYLVLLAEEKELFNLDLHLTSREKEVLTFVANGVTNRYIANKLNVTEGTIKKTVYNAYKKLGIGSRVELVKLLKDQRF